jgi:N utilization substance protein B
VSENTSSASRRRAREVALQVLYAIDLATRERPRKTRSDASEALVADVGTDVLSIASEQTQPCAVFDAVAEHFEMPPGAREFAKELAIRVREHVAELDEDISAHAVNWRVARMAAVDRNVLRLGTYELRFTETPTAIILNEAVDLARRYGSDPSPAFVNGILDAVARGVREVAP